VKLLTRINAFRRRDETDPHFHRRDASALKNTDVTLLRSADKNRTLKLEQRNKEWGKELLGRERNSATDILIKKGIK
jgi:hypothetical protein